LKGNQKSEGIYALLTARGGSRSPPNKNILPVLGRPLMAYALIAANNSKYIRKTYVTTDSEKIAEIGRAYGAEIIWRPPHLCTDTASHADAIVHGYKYMLNELSLSVDIIVILEGNAATITPGIIDKGIEILLKDKEKEIDSCVTVSEYNEYNPARAMRIENGYLTNFIDPSYFTFGTATSDRDSIGDTYFCDGGAWICRARCMDLNYGKPPYRWIGRKIVPLIQEDGLDVDNERGLVVTEYWLKKHGFSEIKTPYDKEV